MAGEEPERCEIVPDARSANQRWETVVTAALIPKAV
jgi:hypothetical protein